MVLDSPAHLAGYQLLAALDFRVIELFHLATAGAHEVVMVLAFIELVNRFAAFEIAAQQDARLLELGQHAVHSGQANVRALVEQHTEHIFRSHVALLTCLENLQNLQARQCGFEARALELFDIFHTGSRWAAAKAKAGKVRWKWPLRQMAGNAQGVQESAATMGQIISRSQLPMHAKARRCVPVLMTLTLCGLMTACSSFNNASRSVASAITPYKVDVVQGNFVSKEQVAALQPGMSRQQVREILGTPLVTSVFHADRWEYVFTLKRAKVEPQTRKLTVFFNGDQFDRSEGDEMPSEAEFVASLGKKIDKIKVPPLEATEAQLARFPVKKSAAEAEAEAVETPPAAPAATAYPPLDAPAR